VEHVRACGRIILKDNSARAVMVLTILNWLRTGSSDELFCTQQCCMKQGDHITHYVITFLGTVLYRVGLLALSIGKYTVC
jgi:hypothetical protein